jgi:hypothetical protein
LRRKRPGFLEIKYVILQGQPAFRNRRLERGIQYCPIIFLKTKTQLPTITIGARVVMATVKMRRGDADALVLLLEAEEKAFETDGIAIYYSFCDSLIGI